MDTPINDPGSDWYRDPGVLLEELQRGKLTARRVPSIDGYDDLREIRRGGQGEVYSATRRDMNRRVAIKVLRDRVLATEVSRGRFDREIELSAGLKHPGIVTVFDRGKTSTGEPYFSMEYVDGVRLDEYIRARARDLGESERLDSAELLQLFGRICAAVSFAHQHGVIHRDLKPSNILIDGNRRPHILDFGLAKATDHGPEGDGRKVTVTGEFMGTLAYTSPEQLSEDASAVDIRSDVFTLGIILYEMLTGRRPFPSSAPMAEFIKAVTEVDALPPSRASLSGDGETRPWPPARGLDDEIDTIVLTALARDPTRRYQSASALQEDVERYLNGEPIAAKRSSGGYLLRKIVQRHKWATAACIGLIVLLFGFGAAMSMMYDRSRTETAKANQIRVFLEDTLGSVEPSAAQRDVTLAEVLDEAVHWVDIALSNEPEVAASIQNTIGNSYRTLGRFDAAETQLQSALETRRQLFGEEHTEVAQSLNTLGLLRRSEGDYDEADRLFNESLAMRRQLLGPDHPDVATSIQNLAVLRQSQGRIDEAGQLFEQTLNVRRAVFGDDHADVAVCQYQLANLAASAGDLDRAEQLHREALQARQRALPDGHPDIARSLLALGELLLNRDDAATAEPFVREYLEIRTGRLPAGHWKIAAAQSALGACLTETGRFAEAEPLLIDSHATLREQRGPDDGATQSARRRIVRLYETWGKSELASEYASATTTD